jgi:uncharacterized protein YcbK (DUF882 family)
MLPEPDFMQKIEAIRIVFGKPMPISSGARCPAYNKKVSGTGTTGPHTTGRAIDIAISGADALDLLSIALDAGMTGIGVAQKGDLRFLHIDDLPNSPTSPRPFIWSY